MPQRLRSNQTLSPLNAQPRAAVRMLFDWLIAGQVMPANPASAVRGPKHVVKTGKTPVLDAAEWRKLLDSIPTDTVRDLRDRALIATLTYSFARITAALNMKVEDLRPQGAGWRLRLHEKGGKHHAMPCHHNLETYLHEYIDGAGLAPEPKALLFQTYSRASAAVVSRLNHLGCVNATGREAFRRLSPPVPASIVSSSYDSIAVAPAATAASPPSRTNQFVALTSKVLVQRSSTIPSRLNRIRGRVACFCLTSRSGAPIKWGTEPHPKSPLTSNMRCEPWPASS
jgi:hypothetical protein